MANDYYQASSTVNSIGEYEQKLQQISDTAKDATDPKVLNSDSYGGNKYKAASFCYPADLLDPTAGNVNHVRFYINIQSDSKAETASMGGIASIQPDRSTMNSIVGKTFNNEKFQNTYAGVKAAEGTLGGLVAGGLLGGDFKGALSGALAGGALNGGKAVATTKVLDGFAGIQFGKPSKRLAGFIALNMPNQLSTRYSMQWQDEEMDLAVSVATNPELAKQIEAVKAAASKGNVKDAAAASANGLGSIGANILLKNNSSLSAASRTAANPRKEQVFKGVDYRRFTFEYQFAPRNPTESQNALNIIRQFKYHMHPEFKDASNFIYIYPSEFDIEYCFGEGANQKLHKISSCVLTEMNINYSPNGVFSTFPDGTPTQINIQMSFVELELLTKDRILKGDM